MRIHKIQIVAIVESLKYIFINNEYADKVIANMFKLNNKFGSKDRKFVAEAIYNIVRWKRSYLYCIGREEIADIQDIYDIISIYMILKNYSIDNIDILKKFDKNNIERNFIDGSKNRAIRESIPDWLDEICVNELGEELWDKEIVSQNKEAEVILRTNTLKISKLDLQAELLKENIHTYIDSNYKDAIMLNERQNVYLTKLFKDGYFEVQDASSQLVAEYMQLQPGMRVIDACAGAGGKSLHISTLMNNKGKLISMDLYQNKLDRLRKRANRNGIFNIEYKTITSSKIIKKLHNSADRVLIDAPCSGTGVLRRNPDTKWKLKPEFIANIIKTQESILKDYSKMLKSGGKLIYATCSILKSENNNQIQKFLHSEEGSNFVLDDEINIFSYQSGYDGFYIARMKKK